MSLIGEPTPTDHGTLTFLAELDAHGDRYFGEVESELHGDLASRRERLALDIIDF